MALSAGTRLGPYEILASIGAGGMGEVYKARDTRLDRVVAIKVAREQFSERFEREARAVAALNHPNICTLYDVGPNYLVMEFIEGGTLAGPIPLPEALPIARQIAEALEAAHEKGLIHRDLKPANIKLTADGKVKVLDFGLAKAFDIETRSPGSDPANSPTLTMSATRAGMILGTAGYMCPEQARGMPVDKRADIWAYGVVLYETLTGREMFSGETVTDTLAAVLKTEMDWTALPPDTPAPIRRLLLRCLQRDRKKRLADIADARLEIDEALAGEPAQTGAPAARRPWAWLALAATAASLAILAIGWSVGGWLRPRLRETYPVRFVLPQPQGVVRGFPVVAPDGRSVAFWERDASGKSFVWIRELGSLTSRKVDSTEDAGGFPGPLQVAGIFWSPDSKSIAFSGDRKLKRVAVTGGPAQVICEPCGAGYGGGWSRNGDILIAGRTRIQRVPAAGGVPTPVTSTDGETRSPKFLPDGRRFLYSLRNPSNPAGSGIYVQEIGSTKGKLLVQSAESAVFVPPGYLLFTREGTLYAQWLDMSGLQMQGEPVILAEGVRSFSASDNGVLTYHTSRRVLRAFWYGRDGKRTPAGLENAFTGVRISPDQNYAVVGARFPTSRELWILEIARGVLSRVILDSSALIESKVAWAPDSRRIAFSTLMPGGTYELREIEVASGAVRTLRSEQQGSWIQDWAPDNRFMMFHQAPSNLETRLFLLPTAGESKPQMLVTLPGAADGFRFSPDGQWIAYASNESRRYEVYVAPLSAPSHRRQASIGGGVQATWRKDSREIFYLALGGKLVAVDVKLGLPPQIGIPKPLFDANAVAAYTGESYSPVGDGNRFLFVEPETREAGEINVVVNWDAGLRRN